MAEYHYKYNPSKGSGRSGKAPDGLGGNNSNGENSNDDLVSWIIIVIALAVFWPLGLFLLFRKLMSASTSSRSNTGRTSATRSGYTYNYTYNKVRSAVKEAAQEVQSTAKEAAQTVRGATQNASSVRPTQSKVAQKRAAKAEPMPGTMAQKSVNPKAGRGFIVTGGIIAGTFLSILLILFSALIAGGLTWEALPALATLGCFTGIGLVFLYVGLFRRKKVKMFRKYLMLIGMRKSVSISTLAKATRRSYKKVCDDLQDMLDQGILPIGYLDLSNDKLVLTTNGIEDELDEEDEEDAAEEARPDDSILAEIRAVNDSIPDPVMSAKIARIEEITGKILDYQRKYPAKAGQLRNFLNYYLPTTLKILRAYAQLEEQGIEGENISAAKARIEGMMDKVVEGFEKQLDKLFQNDVLDISSDVAVLERMLDNDGLGSSGMTMGGI